MEKERPLNIVVGTLLKDEKCLLIRRTKEPYKNYWSIPGGKLEYGEHIAKAVERELKEETGLTVKFTGLKGIVSEVLRDHKTDTVAGHYLIWVCGIKHISGEASEQYEGEVRWFSEGGLEEDRPSVIPSDYLMLKRFAFGSSGPIQLHTVKMLSNENGYKIQHTDL